MNRHFFSIPSVLICLGCNLSPEKELSPCEQWQAAVATCAGQANAAIDSGMFSDTGMPGGEGFGQTTMCGDDPHNDPDWMQDLYLCYVNIYANTDCGRPAALVDLSIQIADCAIINGG
jgi:hypothetical protein